MKESMEILQRYLPVMIKALPTTFYLLFVSVLIALVLGFFLTWAKIGKNKILKALSSIFISFMRGTPMMIQILLIFILVPMLAYQNGVDTSSWNPTIYAIIAFSLNQTAFFAEIFRSAYMSLDFGQIEAAQSLGMNGFQVFRRVILPQGAASALPNATNMSLELMKNTSIAAVIGVYDILGQATQLSRNNYGVGTLELYLTVGVVFWVIGLVILALSNFATTRLNKGNVNFKKVSIFAARH